jgi:hypothetical protein
MLVGGATGGARLKEIRFGGSDRKDAGLSHSTDQGPPSWRGSRPCRAASATTEDSWLSRNLDESKRPDLTFRSSAKNRARSLPGELYEVVLGVCQAAAP